MEQMYQEVILDHYKHPHGRGLREPFGAEVHHVNPTCGDEVTLRVAVSGDGATIDDVSYDGQGCSISQASTSVLHDLIVGKPVGEALATVESFTAMMTSRGKDPGDEDIIGDGIAFTGGQQVPGTREMCTPRLDGVQGRTFPDGERPHRQSENRSGVSMSDETTTATDTPATDTTATGTPAAPPSTSLPAVEDVEEAMRDVVDPPELGINVVDLGLVYGIEVTDDAVAKIDMTLTSAACPLTDVIEDQSRGALVSSGLCTDLEINWVWLPPWGPGQDHRRRPGTAAGARLHRLGPNARRS